MPTLTFTTSGTWQSLTGSPIDCQCTGPGGTGGHAHTALGHDYGGGGGGGGEYAEETALAVTFGNNYSYTVGTGNSANSTVFPGDSVTVTAHAGGNAVDTSAGAGGNGSSNTIHFNGTSGFNGFRGSNYPGGAGGAGAGPGGSSSGGAGGAVNQSGFAPGGGGGGGGGGQFEPGAVGGNGQIVIIYTATVVSTATLAGTGTLTAQANVIQASSNNSFPFIAPGYTWLRRFVPYLRHVPPPFEPPVTITRTATLSGAGTLTAFGSAPSPAVINQWGNNYGQGTTFANITSALQSCVVPLNPNFSVGPGSGTPTAGNWLFTIVSWTQVPAIANVHVGVGDDAHSWWREYPAAGSGGNTRTSIAYTPNILGNLQNVYVAPDMEVAAINVLVIEVNGMTPWDTVVGTSSNYTANGTSVSMSIGAPAQFSFFLGATGGDNVSSGQAFQPSGWLPLVTQSQTNGANNLADNILTAAYLPQTISGQSVSGTSSSAENLSGFMIAVYQNGINPIPAGHNPNWPLMVFEAGFGSGFNTPDSEVTWTDISNRLWDWDETTGIQFQLGQLQSTNLTLHLDDVDGFLIPNNASSPYYPNVQPGTPVRLRAAIGTLGGITTNRWYVIQRNISQWPEEIDEVFRRYCPVSGTDLWAALSSTPPTFYRSEIYEDSPYAWWPCDDQPGTGGVLPKFLLNAALGNPNVLNIVISPAGATAQQQLTMTGGGATFGTGGAAVYTVGADQGWMFGDQPSAVSGLSTSSGNPVTATPGSAAWQTSGQFGTTGSHGWFLSCNDTGLPPLSGGVTIEGWFNYGFSASSQGDFTYIAPLFQDQPNPSTHNLYQSQPLTALTLIELATSSAPVAVLQLDTSGHLNLITYNGATGTSNSIYTASDLRAQTWFMVTMSLTTTTWHVQVNGGATADVSGTAAGMTSAWTYFIVNGDMGAGGGGATGGLAHGGNVAVSHLAVYPYVLPYYRILDHYWAAVTDFGQLPVPSAIQFTAAINALAVNPNAVLPQQITFTPDGAAFGGAYGITGTGTFQSFGQGGLDFSGTGLLPFALTVVVVNQVGPYTSGPSAWAVFGGTGTFELITGTIFDYFGNAMYVSWTGVGASFAVYTASQVGAETNAATVVANSDTFDNGYGATALGGGPGQTASGTGATPPTAGTAIGDTVGQRIERLMRGGRCSSPNRCIDPAPLLVQAPGVNGGAQVGAEIQQIQQSDGGMLFVDNQNHLTYWQRPHLAGQYSSPVWNIGPTTSAGRIPYYKEIHWVTDPQRIYNVITIVPVSPTGAALPEITPANGSAVNTSQIRYGAQPLSVTSFLQSQTEMQNQANWLFTFFGTPQRHIEDLKIEAAAYPQGWQLVMGINIGDVVLVEDWVIGGGGPVYTYRVTELQRHITQGFGSNAATTASVTLTCDFEPTSYWT